MIHGLLKAASRKRIATDPYWANVISLLHFDSGSALFPDIKTPTWTPYGTATANGSAKFGDYAGVFNGGGSYIRTSNLPLIGVSDFTVEGHIKIPSITSSVPRIVFDSRKYPASHDGVVVWITTDGKLFVGYTDSGFTGVTVLAADTWHHIAIVRISGVFKSFVNGILQGSQTPPAKNFNHNGAVIATAADNLGAYSFTGLLDEWRITSGVGRYADTFTPFDGAFPEA